MTDQVVTDIVKPIAPELIASVQAIQAFVTAMGPDPTKWVLNYPGAKLILVGTILSQLPATLQSEGSALDTAINAQLGTIITKIQAL